MLVGEISDSGSRLSAISYLLRNSEVLYVQKVECARSKFDIVNVNSSAIIVISLRKGFTSSEDYYLLVFTFASLRALDRVMRDLC